MGAEPGGQLEWDATPRETIRRGRSVVVSALKEVESIVTHQVDEAMLLGDSTRPDVGTEVPDRLGLADTREGVTADGFDEVHDLQGHTTIRLNPKPQVFAELVLEDGGARSR